MTRPSNDEYFMEMAHLVASRSTCLRRKVGAVMVADKRVLTTGYNGAPKGLPHCGRCDDMPCEQLKAFAYGGEHGDDGRRIENLRAAD